MGASGLLGSELYYYLNKHNFKCYGSYFKTKKKKLIRINLLNYKELYIVLKKLNPNVIINCVSLTNVDECERNYNKSKNYNIDTSKNLVKVLNKLNKKVHLIHISTDQIYNKKSVNKYSKENEVKISNNYSKTKFLGELAIKKYEHNTILRTNFFGESKFSRMSFSDYIFNNLRKNKKISLPKNIFFNPLSISLLVKFIKKIIQKKIIGTYNICSDKNLSKYEFGLMIAKKFNLNIHNINGFVSNYKLHRRPLNTSRDNKKIKKIIKIRIPSIKNQLKS